MGVSAAVQALIAIAVIHTVITTFLVVAVLLVLFWCWRRGSEVKVKPQDENDGESAFPTIRLEPLKEEPETTPEIDMEGIGHQTVPSSPPPKLDLSDRDYCPERRPSSSTPDIGFGGMKRARISIASITSNISRQFGLRRSMVEPDEEGTELISAVDKEGTESCSDDIDGNEGDSEFLKEILRKTRQDENQELGLDRRESDGGDNNGISGLVLTLEGDSLEDSSSC